MPTFSKTRTARFRTSTIIRRVNDAIHQPRTNVDAISQPITNVDNITPVLTQNDNSENRSNKIIGSDIERYFKTMYCVNLESRPDRWKQTVEEFKKLGPDYTLNRFNAIQNVNNPELGCATSFLTLIQMAKDQNMPAILIGEDDIMLYSKSAEMWEKAISELPDNWDILSGGMYHTQNRVKVSNMLCKVGDFSSTHYICVRNTCYDKILSYFKNNMHRKHIDRFMGKLSEQKRINVYLAWPMIARQRAGYSDLRKTNTDNNISCKLKGLVFISDTL